MSALDRHWTLLAVAGTLLSTLPSPAQAQTAADAATTVDEIFAAWNGDSSAGCAVGVTRHGETVLERAYGMSDLEHGIPNDPETIFEGGSVSKQFTAAAVVLLALDGVLSLEDDIRTYVPELPDYGTPITLHHLMTHTSGLRDWGSVAAISGWGRGERSHDHDDVVDILSRQTALNFEPGHEYSYSNSGYNLLAIVVDRVSESSFADFSRDRIFEPLGMTSTQWRANYRQIVPGRSTAYRRTGAGWEIDRPIEYVHGNGGILTTVGDLGRWNQALEDGGPWGDHFLELMHTQGTLNDGSRIAYAGGLMVGELGGVASVTHTGSTAGYRAFLGRYPEQGLSVAMLCNASNVATGGTGRRIAEAFLGNAVQHPPQPNYAAESTGFDLRPYTGSYREPVTGSPVALQLRDGVLRARTGTGASVTALLPESAIRFRIGTSDRYYVFDRDGDQVTGFTLEDGESYDRHYDRVMPWNPTPEQLAELRGTYESEDAETTFVVDVTDGELTIWQRPADVRGAIPLYRDAFILGNGSIVRFRRDGAGRPTALSLSLGRVYDMRFARIEG